MSDSVKTLRRAATLMREDPDKRWHLVAEWLDASARAYEALAGDRTSITYLTPANVPTMLEALTVARAFEVRLQVERETFD